MSYGKRGVEQKDTLSRPPCQISVVLDVNVKVMEYLAQYGAKGGRQALPVLDGERQPIGILVRVRCFAYNYDLELAKWAFVEGSEDILSLGIDLLLQPIEPAGFPLPATDQVVAKKALPCLVDMRHRDVHLQRKPATR